MESKKAKLLETETRLVVTSGWGGGGKGDIGQRALTGLAVTRQVSSGNLMYSMVVIVTNIIYSKVAEKVNLKCSYPPPLPPKR